MTGYAFALYRLREILEGQFLFSFLFLYSLLSRARFARRVASDSFRANYNARFFL